MRLLLDTHVFFWFVWDDPQLSTAARIAIESPTNEVYLSAASYWELAIKVSAKKIKPTEAIEPYVSRHVQNNQISILPITVAHAARVATLPLHHRDPFDRMLIAQAIAC